MAVAFKVNALPFFLFSRFCSCKLISFLLDEGRGEKTNPTRNREEQESELSAKGKSFFLKMLSFSVYPSNCRRKGLAFSRNSGMDSPDGIKEGGRLPSRCSMLNPVPEDASGSAIIKGKASWHLKSAPNVLDGKEGSIDEPRNY
ncbi:hypothetical protein CDAR_416941 [Caerostris darwini]|uniref:Uncharacterized protein n=1 Tax=Caerostris darwini TaxID=1538125 RepID=A0AAV4X515_9ARAC|nr:hypothetical protein CDAR_416941 [Caerostris darwini]